MYCFQKDEVSDIFCYCQATKNWFLFMRKPVKTQIEICLTEVLDRIFKYANVKKTGNILGTFQIKKKKENPDATHDLETTTVVIRKTKTHVCV